jgi:glycosyltransferase involved in cell wall biosynthesis
MKYYVYTIKRLATIAATRPGYFISKSLTIMLRSPGKIIDLFTRRYILQDWRKKQRKLQKEYHTWIETVEKPSLNVKKQKQEIHQFAKKPLISLVTPVFNPPLNVHKELIESVLAQTYSNFELLLCNFGNDPEVEKLIDDYASKDQRVKVKQKLENKGISANSNLCLEDVVGEFVGLLDHDDALMPNALFECVKLINKKEVDFIYSDKDKITEDGERFEPFFKPDWSPELELGGNYVTHFNLMRTKLLKDIGGWDPETDGAQDWDVFWRIMEKTDKVAHIPKILYHWRTVEGSTSNEITAKSYVIAAQNTTARKHLQAAGLNAEPFHDFRGQMYIDWKEPAGKKVFAIHMLYKNTKNIGKTIKFIQKQPDFDSNSKILLFCLRKDLARKHGKEIEKKYGITVCEYRTGEFIKTFTERVGTTSYDSICYIADSVEKIYRSEGKTNWISQLSGWLSSPDIGIAGGLSLSYNKRVVDCGSYFDTSKRNFAKYYFDAGFCSGYSGYLQWIRNFILVSERLFVFKTSLLKELAGREELLNLRDDELPKLLALTNYSLGNRAVYDPTVVAVDKAPFHVIIPPSDTLTEYSIKKCPDLHKDGDPYYNINLDKNYCDPKPKLTDKGKNRQELSDYDVLESTQATRLVNYS